MTDPRSKVPGARVHARWRWLGAGAAIATTAAGMSAAWVALVQCDQSSTTLTYTPISGIEIQSASLVLGHGCSNDPSDPNAVYRYSAIVSYANEAGVVYASGSSFTQQYSGVFECFSDAFFENLLSPDAGDQSFSITIAAWNVSHFPAQLDPCSSEPDANATPTVGPYSLPADLCPAEQPAFVAGVVAAGGADTPQWTTTCTAFTQANIPGIASCGPLISTGVGLTAPDAGGTDGESPAEASSDAAIAD